MKSGEKRILVAKEAANLLYYNFVNEYKPAKENASRTLGIKSLPSNFEIAIELDRIADEVENVSKKDLLVRLRKEALTVMNDLKSFNPKLVGSVWRGTAKRGSDIDIIVYSQNYEPVLAAIKNKYDIQKVEHTSKTNEGDTERFVHIHFSLPSDDEIELVVRDYNHVNETYKCDIYGDFITGLTLSQLRNVLKTDSIKKFIPKIK